MQEIDSPQIRLVDLKWRLTILSIVPVWGILGLECLYIYLFLFKIPTCCECRYGDSDVDCMLFIKFSRWVKVHIFNGVVSESRSSKISHRNCTVHIWLIVILYNFWKKTSMLFVKLCYNFVEKALKKYMLLPYYCGRTEKIHAFCKTILNLMET